MIVIDTKLKLLTGLHIGGGDDTMKIGGIDSPVVKREVFCDEKGEIGFPKYEDKSDKNKITNDLKKLSEPYIPGSSLKGKIRSLLEHEFGLIVDSHVVNSKTEVAPEKEKHKNLIVKLFGEGAGNSENSKDEIRVTRLIFRDSFITKEVRKAVVESRVKLFEEKWENVIDRKSGTTIKGGLRQIERVASAIEFDCDIVIRVFENEKLSDNKELFKKTLILGLKLLERDALGGSGSRGYGRVEFEKYKSEDIKELKDFIEKNLNK